MAKPKDTAKPRGRQSTYTPALGALIAERLSTGEPLAQICRDEGMPSDHTVRNWMDADPTYASAIARAREIGYDVIAAQCLLIADDSASDYTDSEKGPAFNAEHVQRSKLRIETRLKLLAKWDPKRYGDKVAVTGDGGGPVQTATEVTFKIVRPGDANPAD